VTRVQQNSKAGGTRGAVTDFGAEVRVCVPPDWAELLARVGVQLVPMGVW
jgi:hypothetical protein